MDTLVVTLFCMAPVFPLAFVCWLNWSALRLEPVRWLLQLASLTVPLGVAFVTIHDSCRVTQGPQPRCPEALAWAPACFWGLFGLQVCIAILLAWTSPRRSVWIPLQGLFLVHGYLIAVGGILSVTGQWL
jgi:hypothetical protein